MGLKKNRKTIAIPPPSPFKQEPIFEQNSCSVCGYPAYSACGIWPDFSREDTGMLDREETGKNPTFVRLVADGRESRGGTLDDRYVLACTNAHAWISTIRRVKAAKSD